MKEILKDLGLLENELAIYLALLKIGSSTAATIADKTGLYRPYVYDNLNRLMEKGIVSVVLKDNKKHFRDLVNTTIVVKDMNKEITVQDDAHNEKTYELPGELVGKIIGFSGTNDFGNKIDGDRLARVRANN